MKRIRYLTGVGNSGPRLIPGGQVLCISCVPSTANAAECIINESTPINIPVGTTLNLIAEELGWNGNLPVDEGGRLHCDQYPGEGQITVEFRAPPGGDFAPPRSWLIIYNG